MLSLFIPTSRELVGSRTKGRQQQWRDGALGIQPQRDNGGMLCHSPASLLEGVKEVRSEVLSLFIPVYPDKSGTSRELVGSRTKGRQQRWRDGTLGISRKGIKDVCAAKLPRLPLRGVKEVRSEVLSLFIPTSRELVGSRTKGRQQRWRDGTLGISRKGIKDVCAAKLPRLPLRGVKEVRSEVLSLFIPTSRELVGSRTKGRQQRWRDGALGIQPRRDKGCMRSQTPPPLGRG